MSTIIPKPRFDKSGYYFLVLVGLVLLGFWPSYFSKFFAGTVHHSFYFHFHAIMMSLWISALIVQPILIRKKKLALHKSIGRLSYVMMPLLFLSVILLTHYRIQYHVLVEGNERLYGPHLMIPFKDLLILAMAYIIAVVYRHDVNIHARAMIATGIVFIEPALVRFLKTLISGGSIAYLCTIAFVYSILIVLIILERRQSKGRWVFPLILASYICVHSLIISEAHNSAWETFAQWFASLPLT